MCSRSCSLFQNKMDKHILSLSCVITRILRMTDQDREAELIVSYRVSAQFGDIRLSLGHRVYKEGIACTYILPREAFSDAFTNRTWYLVLVIVSIPSAFMELLLVRQ